MPGYIYLASPYSHPAAKMRRLRYLAVMEKAAELMENGQPVFCPIAHNHILAEYLRPDLLLDFDFWMDMDLPMVEQSSAVWVYALPGWDASRGVEREIEYTKQLGKPLRIVFPSYLHNLQCALT